MGEGVQLQDVVRRVKAQASRSVNGEALVVLTDKRELHRLNAVGTRIWELCDARCVADIVDDIVREFDVEREVAEQDVCAFLSTMHTLGAVEIERSSEERE